MKWGFQLKKDVSSSSLPLCTKRIPLFLDLLENPPHVWVCHGMWSHKAHGVQCARGHWREHTHRCAFPRWPGSSWWFELRGKQKQRRVCCFCCSHTLTHFLMKPLFLLCGYIPVVVLLLTAAMATAGSAAALPLGRAHTGWRFYTNFIMTGEQSVTEQTRSAALVQRLWHWTSETEAQTSNDANGFSDLFPKGTFLAPEVVSDHSKARRGAVRKTMQLTKNSIWEPGFLLVFASFVWQNSTDLQSHILYFPKEFSLFR